MKLNENRQTGRGGDGAYLSCGGGGILPSHPPLPPPPRAMSAVQVRNRKVRGRRRTQQVGRRRRMKICVRG
jgi:hypothetical protein